MVDIARNDIYLIIIVMLIQLDVMDTAWETSVKRNQKSRVEM